MIEIKASRKTVSIGSIDRSGLDTIVELYNSSEGYRYATGVAYPVSRDDIALKLDRLETSKNEFFSGIYGIGQETGNSLLIGAVSGIMHGNTLWIRLIAILPQFRNKGMGSAAARLVFDYGKAVFNISDVLLSVIGKNEPGIQFWLKQGFSETGRFTKMLFGDTEPYEVIIMRKKL